MLKSMKKSHKSAKRSSPGRGRSAAPPPPKAPLAGAHFMRAAGLRPKVGWFLPVEIDAIERYCRDFRYAPPKELGPMGRKGLTYQQLLRAVVVNYLKGAKYLPKNHQMKREAVDRNSGSGRRGR